MLRSRRIRPDTPLVGDVNAEDRFERFPSHFTMKGMFFSRMIDLGGERAYRSIEERLLKKPSLGRYLPFSDYPQVDFSRLAHAVAIARNPNVDNVEAMRRLAREDIATFARSGVGSVMLALVGSDPISALMKLPDMYRASLRGGEVKAELESAHIVRLTYVDFYGWLDCYPIGHIEGLAEHLGRSCEIEMHSERDTAATFRVHIH